MVAVPRRGGGFGDGPYSGRLSRIRTTFRKPPPRRARGNKVSCADIISGRRFRLIASVWKNNFLFVPLNFIVYGNIFSMGPEFSAVYFCIPKRLAGIIRGGR